MNRFFIFSLFLIQNMSDFEKEKNEMVMVVVVMNDDGNGCLRSSGDFVYGG